MDNIQESTYTYRLTSFSEDDICKFLTKNRLGI